MDYRYIEQLVEHYFECKTTLQEEQILRAFFTQDEADVPASLRQWRPLFAALSQDEHVSEGFEERVLALTEGAPRVKARTVSLGERLRPLFRAAAVVAIVLALGQAMHFSTSQNQEQSDDINYANYKDTYDDPAMAYDQVEDALQLMSESFSHSSLTDSVKPAVRNTADSISMD